jgi:glycolate oxidase
LGTPEAEFAAFFAFDDYLKAHRTVHHIVTSGIATLAGTVLFDEKKIEYLRRDDEAFIPMPSWVNSIVATALYGTKAEVTAASKILMEKGRAEGGRYTGDHMAVGDWASRHDRYANPLHGRIPGGQVVPMSWHCEDASLNRTVLPRVREEWTGIAQRYLDE